MSNATNVLAPAPLADFSQTPAAFTMRRLYRQSRPGGAMLEIGYAFVPAGMRAPQEGEVALPVDDIGIVFEGRIDGMVGGVPTVVPRRTLVLTPDDVPQSAVFPVPTEMAYLFFGDAVSVDDVPRPTAVLPLAEGPITIWNSRDFAREDVITPVARLETAEDATLEIGYAFAPAGMTMPAEGGIAVPAHDLEIFLSGRAEAIVGGEHVTVSPGDIVYIRPGEAQWVRFLEDTELLYIFFGAPVELPDFDAIGGGA